MCPVLLGPETYRGNGRKKQVRSHKPCWLSFERCHSKELGPPEALCGLPRHTLPLVPQKVALVPWSAHICRCFCACWFLHWKGWRCYWVCCALCEKGWKLMSSDQEGPGWGRVLSTPCRMEWLVPHKLIKLAVKLYCVCVCVAGN